MTANTIIKNLIDLKCREALENKLNIMLDFAEIEMSDKRDSDTWTFKATLKELGKPWGYRVDGYITYLGQINLVFYKRSDDIEIHTFNA